MEPDLEVVTNDVPLWNTTDMLHNATNKKQDWTNHTIAINITLLIITVVGSISVIFSISITKKKSRLNFFIINLAVSDLLVGIGNILPGLLWIITKEFYGSTVVCKFTKLLMNLSTSASNYALVSLSIDRLHAVMMPLHRMTTRSYYSIVLAGLGWFFALLLNIPEVVRVKIIDNEYGRQCWVEWSTPVWKIFMVLLAFAVFIIPAILIAACHVAIVIRIWRSNHMTSCPPNRSNLGARTPSQVSNSLVMESQLDMLTSPATASTLEPRPKSIKRNRTRDYRSNAGIISKAKIKSVKLTCAIVAAFICCWSPFMLWNLLMTFDVINPSNNPFVSVVMTQLTSLNAAVNSVIYWIFNWRFVCGSHKQPLPRPPPQHKPLLDEPTSNLEEIYINKNSRPTGLVNRFNGVPLQSNLMPLTQSHQRNNRLS